MGFNTSSIQEKVQPVVNAIQNNVYLKAVTSGLTTALPALIVGSMSTLLANIPINAYQEFIVSAGIKPFLALPLTLTTELISLYAVFFIAYNLTKNFDKDGAIAGLLSLVSFLFITPLMQESGPAGITTYIPTQWLGAQGLFVAIIIGLVVGRLYCFILDKKWTIKMPDGVPPTVSQAFAGLIPGFIILTIFILVKALFQATSYGSLHQLIYSSLQVPLQGLGGTLGALIIFMLVAHLLWVFGIHGMLVTFSLMMPLYVPLDNANLVAYGAGQPLPNIIGLAFVVAYILIGGSGATLGINILMAFRAKSQRYKILGRLALPGGVCGINEPIIFGTPVVLNPILAIPFILTPIVNAIIAYTATVLNFVPRLPGVGLPLGVPVIVSGFLQGSVRIVALQIVLIFIGIFIYYPFFVMLDKKAHKEETDTGQGTTGQSAA